MLNRYIGVETAEAFVEASGLVGIIGACTPRFTEKFLHVLASEFNDLTFPRNISEEELSRAKNMLKCNVLTCLESHQMIFEDIGQQLVFDDKYIPPVEICAKIDAVTAEDISRVAVAALRGGPSIASVGTHVAAVPSIGAVRGWFGLN